MYSHHTKIGTLKGLDYLLESLNELRQDVEDDNITLELSISTETDIKQGAPYGNDCWESAATGVLKTVIELNIVNHKQHEEFLLKTLSWDQWK